MKCGGETSQKGGKAEATTCIPPHFSGSVVHVSCCEKEKAKRQYFHPMCFLNYALGRISSSNFREKWLRGWMSPLLHA